MKPKPLPLLILLAVMTGCSQTPTERRETAKAWLMAPFVGVGKYLDSVPMPDTSTDTQNLIDQQDKRERYRSLGILEPRQP